MWVAKSRAALVAEGIMVAALALLALAVGSGLGPRVWSFLTGGGGSAAAAALHLLGPGASGRVAPKPPADHCARWQHVSRLAGGCLAELPGGVDAFQCCGGENYTCVSCPGPKMDALRCISPRHMLLRAAAGCETGFKALPPLPPAGECTLSSDAVDQGRWMGAARPGPGLAPGLPPLLFQAAGVRGTAPRPLLGSAEVPGRLWAAGFDRVVVSGDSTVRHFYNRLVGLVRQQDTLIDGGGIAHAHYHLQTWAGSAGSGNAAAGSFATDELWVAPAANWVKGLWDLDSMGDGLDQLLARTIPGPDATAGTEAPDSASSAGAPGRHLTLDFVVGAKAEWLLPHVRQYFADPQEGGGSSDGSWRQRTLLVMSLCVWEQSRPFPNGWEEFLTEMRASVRQVVLLTCPLDRLQRAQHAEGKEVVAKRNERLRWTVSARRGGRGRADTPGPGSPLMLVDMDALTRHLPPGLEIAPIDFHYACMLGNRGAYNGTGPLPWSGSDGRPEPTYPRMRYEQLLVPSVGTCADPVNHAGVQLLLSMLC